MNPDILFTPFECGPMKLANRIVMAPMTRGFAPNGVPGDDVAEYYRKRAEGGVGLIVTEGTLINHPAATDSTNYPLFYGEEPLAGWKKVVDTVHAAGGKIIPQLWHVGATRRPGTGPVPSAATISPSGLVAKDKALFKPATIQEIDQLIAAFAQAAVEAKRIGFDGIELHGAHGYLIDQFFWADTNRRNDEFGGSLQARSRFAIEIVKAVRQCCGKDFPIVLRWSQWKQQDYSARLVDAPDVLAEFLLPLSEAGVDIFHCSQRRFWEPEFEHSSLNLAGWTKEITGKPTISVGSVGLDQEFMTAFAGGEAGLANIDQLIEKMQAHEFDLIAIGRALLSNPDWANNVKEGRLDKLKPFTQADKENLN